MKTLSITYVKNHFSAVVKEVQHAGAVMVSDHGKAVVRLDSVAGMDDPGAREGALADMERKGLVRRPRRKLASGFLDASPVRTRDGSSVVKALLEERESGR